ncbi:nuclear mRNA splicing factor-associated protein [Gongronella butleri]|nr:nuclear mRNA splicing factor-associated protein [Gongronella butleri]
MNGPSIKKEDFESDPRMSKNEQTGKWSYKGDDGVEFEYDDHLNAWFPMYNEELIAQQQSAYAVEGVDELAPAVDLSDKKKKKRVYTYDEQKAAEEPSKKPKKEVKNTSVYVSGLPADVTIHELRDTFSKCGVIMEDLDTGEPKIKLYRNKEGELQGDGLVTFFREESIALAIQLLNDCELRLGDASSVIHVEKATFKEKQPSDASKPKQPPKSRAKKKLHQLNRKLDWVEEETGKKSEKFAKIVILKNMYTQKELDDEPTLLLELKEDVREECERLGEVTNVILYDKSPGGIISVRFAEPKVAKACVLMMNNRYFAGKQISAEIYDGKTKYQKSGGNSAEDEQAEKERLERYAKWLEGEEHGDDEPGVSNDATATAATAATPPPSASAASP